MNNYPDNMDHSAIMGGHEPLTHDEIVEGWLAELKAGDPVRFVDLEHGPMVGEFVAHAHEHDPDTSKAWQMVVVLAAFPQGNGVRMRHAWLTPDEYEDQIPGLDESAEALSAANYEDDPRIP